MLYILFYHDDEDMHITENFTSKKDLETYLQDRWIDPNDILVLEINCKTKSITHANIKMKYEVIE